MSRYIDADAIEFHEDDAVYRHEIDAQPTADVRENVRGEWIYLYEDNYKCSICGSWWCCTDSQIDEMNYCPNCGADMRGES